MANKYQIIATGNVILAEESFMQANFEPSEYVLLNPGDVPTAPIPTPPSLEELEVDAIALATKINQRIAVTAELEAGNVTDEEIATVAYLYPAWDGEAVAYVVGDVVRWSNGLYKVIQAHTSQAGWDPVSVPALFSAYRAAGTVTAWVQPIGPADAYSIGERVTHLSSTWESTINANVWEPGIAGTEALWIDVG